MNIAYTIKRKQNAPSSFMKFCRISISGQCRNAFLVYCLHFTLVSDCKITNKFPIHKKNFATARKKIPQWQSLKTRASAQYDVFTIFFLLHKHRF